MKTTTITATNLDDWNLLHDLRDYVHNYITTTLGQSLLDYTPVEPYTTNHKKTIGILDKTNFPLLACLAYYSRKSDTMLLFIGTSSELENASQLARQYDQLMRETLHSYTVRV